MCKWTGAPCTQSSFIVMAPGPRHTAGPTETPPPPYTGRAGGGGTRKRERTRSARSRDLLRHRAALSCDHIQRRGGGTHRVIGHVTQASSVEGCTRSVYYYPMPGKGRKYHRNTHLSIVRKRGRPSDALALGFLLIARLLLILKGYL